MIIYQISLPKKQDAQAFITFMQKEYFPAIHKGPTRVGQVTDLVLLRREARAEADNDKGPEFFWHVGWGGLPMLHISVDDEKVASKFKKFKAKVQFLGFYGEVAGWHGKA
ncbi:MAG: hypothetical protein QOC70_1962 [Verrucomicrobiota bacterium]|jgi:hypothetical protein